MAKHPVLDEYLRDLSARTEIDHVFGDDEAARRRGPGKVVIWTPPPQGVTWIDASPPGHRFPEANTFVAVDETLQMNVWGTDTFHALSLLFKIWREGFDPDTTTRHGQPRRQGPKSWGTVGRNSEFSPSNGFAVTDRVVMQYLLPRQGEIYGEIKSAGVSGEMQDKAGNQIGVT